MTLGSTLTRVAQFAPAIALAFGVASADAQSLKAGQCFKGDKIASVLGPALEKDGQKNIAQAAEVDGADTARRYYSNADGTLGYDLKGNLPNSQKQSEYCVKGVLTNIALLSRNQVAPPSWLGAKSGDGKTTGSDLTKLYSLGNSFVMVAQAVGEKGGKQYYGNKLGILAKANGEASLEVIENGRSSADYMVNSFTFTQHGEALFARQSGQSVAQAPINNTLIATNVVPVADRRP